MDKKKIIIIAVVAVLLYLLYKKGVFSSLLGNSGGTSTDTTGGSSSTGSFGVDTNDTDSIISGTSMTSSLQTECKSWVRTIEKKVATITDTKASWYKANLISKAEDYGITYQQQLVLEAIWQMYKTKGTISKKQCDTYSEEVRSM